MGTTREKANTRIDLDEKIAHLLYGFDALTALKRIASNSIHTIVTSPPYWGLRSYGEGDLGLEETPELYVKNIVKIFRQCRRVLREDGTLWLNLGDSYNGSGGEHKDGKGQNGLGVKNRGKVGIVGQKKAKGLKPKDLVGIPWRVAFALQADGWWLRSDIIWSKPNPMPESVQDRPTKSHEYIFLMTKSQVYFYDAVAIRETAVQDGLPMKTPDGWDTAPGSHGTIHREERSTGKQGTTITNGRNKRTVWTVTTQAYADAHFATFPMEIPKLCIEAGTSKIGSCKACGNQYKRMLEPSTQETVGWEADCKCKGGGPIPSIVLDPFSGSGTTGEVATGLGRRYVGIEINEKYATLANKRIGLFGL